MVIFFTYLKSVVRLSELAIRKAVGRKSIAITNGSRREFRSALMEKGFYPESVPPVFVVKDFHHEAERLNLFDEIISLRDKPFSLVRYSETKRGNQRRVFSVPNPIFFIDVSEYIAKHRRPLNTLLSKSKISRSIPKFDPVADRAITIENFSDFNKERRIKLASSKYIIKSDISRFYHSIYTHSIPWAMHGKVQAKSDRSTRSTQTYGNKFDFLIRQSQDQQTVGVPVGPDISRIVAELISGAIDQDFVAQVGSDISAIRLVDDIYIGANSLDEAHSLLSTYRDSIRKFELDINESKTRIVTSSQDLEDYWPVEIRRELEGYKANQGKEAERDLPYYLDEVIRKANAKNDEGIVKFAIRKFDTLRLWEPYWSQLETFLVRSAINFPHTLDYVCRVVAWRNRRFFINLILWESVCREIIAYHARLGNDSEVTWALWLVKEIGASIPSVLAEEVFGRCGSLPCLLVLDLERKSRIIGRFHRKVVYQRLGDSPMLGNDWLLAYEAERAFEYRLKTKNRKDYSVFGDLIDRNVSFYDFGARLFVFQGLEFDDAEGAIEDRLGFYDDEEDEPEGEDGDFEYIPVD